MNTEYWSPKTKVGTLVKNNDIDSLTEVLTNYSIIEPEIIDYLEKDLLIKVVCTDRISHTLKSGKIYGFRVVVLVGKQGFIGCGVGKSTVKAQAIKKGVLEAKKSMLSLVSLKTTGLITPRLITKDKKGATTVTITPLTGTSVTASKLGRSYCELCGLKGIKIHTGNKKRERKGKVASKLNYFTALHTSLKGQII